MSDLSERIEKLPAWARQHIQWLQRRVDEAEAAVAAAAGGEAPLSRIAAETYGNKIYLPPHTRVVYRTGPDWDFGNRISVDLILDARGHRLSIRGDERLCIYPEVTNVLEVGQLG